eukprot:TRINITY_DN1036_c0_g1_i1.p1 TRINITY_DN1036_c0_g1~~TRINITY_DN1036_c0_g1_i1.p1  ORF type:complete len:180 (-),score=17.47 TRINITY_DN1036_c0_g1_i1:114-653(-)
MLINRVFLPGVFLLLLSCCLEAHGKICWKECQDLGIVTFADIEGCHRRTGKDGRTPKFRCNGTTGPPCTVIRGETVHLNLKFNPGIVVKNVTQGAFWESGLGMDIPWAGLAVDACEFMADNKDCKDDGVKEVQAFSYPIYINTMYPSGTYNLRWLFDASDVDTGIKKALGCLRFTIRII